jgi:hypothetical protein
MQSIYLFHIISFGLVLILATIVFFTKRLERQEKLEKEKQGK